MSDRPISGNAPPFDPLFPTPEEMSDMLDGYRAGGEDKPKPAITSVAFDHGWRMRRNDKAGAVDEDQRELARRHRHAPSRARRSRGGGIVTEAARYIRCPFCGEDDFDLAGLKTHIIRGWCDAFDDIGSPERSPPPPCKDEGRPSADRGEERRD